MMRLALLFFWSASIACAADDRSAQLLFARMTPLADQPTYELLGSGPDALQDRHTPLGSIWKLFVYAYAVDQKINTPDYVCTGDVALSTEESYCCDQRKSISRDDALGKSCGLFFEPRRLRIDKEDWRKYWSSKTPDIPWLAHLDKLVPGSKVPIASVLTGLQQINGAVREQAESALLANIVYGSGKDALKYLGGKFRVKTFTWAHPQMRGRRLGGGAGWLEDGTVVWFGAEGTSTQVLSRYASQLAKAIDTSASSLQTSHGNCVDVALFARYPLIRVTDNANKIVSAGDDSILRGSYIAHFKNGNQLPFSSAGEIEAVWSAEGTLVLSARLSEDEYVARVLDREGSAKITEAARALSVVIRTYLHQNGTPGKECIGIDDSSRTQRVSPRPASLAARKIAAFTSGLVLRGEPVQYHLDSDGINVMSWKKTVAQAESGMAFDEILGRAFTRADLAPINGQSQCHVHDQAQRWLQQQALQWQPLLVAEPGFEHFAPRVCLLAVGNPYSDPSRGRIFVRGLSNLNDRLSLAHEYLHIAFASFPSGRDEAYIERWAKRLVMGRE